MTPDSARHILEGYLNDKISGTYSKYILLPIKDEVIHDIRTVSPPGQIQEYTFVQLLKIAYNL